MLAIFTDIIAITQYMHARYTRCYFMVIMYSFISGQISFICEKYSFTTENNDFVVDNNFFSHKTKFISKLTNKVHPWQNIFRLSKRLFHVTKLISSEKNAFHLWQKKIRLWQNVFLSRQNKIPAWQKRREKRRVCAISVKTVKIANIIILN